MVVCGVDRLPWKATRRTLILGLIMGSSLKMLSWGKEQLQSRADILSKNVSTGVPGDEDMVGGENEGKEK